MLRLERFLRLLFRDLVHPASRFPADPRAIFVLALSVFGGGTALLLDAAPATLESQMPAWSVVIWGVLLTLGSALTLFGMFKQTLNGIILEQIGSITVGAMTVFYAIVGIAVVGLPALQPLGIILAWGLACGIRWLQLQLLIMDAYHRKVADDVRDTLISLDAPPDEER